MIDIYHFNVIQDNSVDFFVAKRDNDDIRVLFGYSSNPLNESLYNNIFVGSFAKTDSGFWKFYPKMQYTKLSKEEIYYKYTGEQI